MPRIIIASASEASRWRLNRLLTASGFSVFKSCASGGELRRALNACEDGIAILLGPMPDCLPDDIAGDFSVGFQFLLIARPEALEDCESPDVFKLTYPCGASVVAGAVEMLSQFHARQLPRRAGEDKRLVEDAKRLLMERDDLTEPEAHRRMQTYAMRHNMKMTEYAQELLRGGT